MDTSTRERFKWQLEALHAERSAAVEGKADATGPVTLDTSIGRLSRMDAIQSQQMALGPFLLGALLKAGVRFAVIVPACAVLGVVAIGISFIARSRLN